MDFARLIFAVKQPLEFFSKVFKLDVDELVFSHHRDRFDVQNLFSVLVFFKTELLG